MSPPQHMDRADLYFVRSHPAPNVVLVLCPGCNGNGVELIRQPAWQRFAEQNGFGLVGLSFSSNPELLSQGKGYYYPSAGSGEALIRALRKIYGTLPKLLLFGFSGGAHFVSRFVEWKPQQVLAWCAYSAAWWDQPAAGKSAPPGIVACGDEDGTRYGASLSYFLQGRSSGKRWTWVSLGKKDHSSSLELEAFVRDYFASMILIGSAHTGKDSEWRDNDTKMVVSDSVAAAQSVLTSWFPTRDVGIHWANLHRP